MVKVLWAEAGADLQFVPEIDRRFPESAVRDFEVTAFCRVPWFNLYSLER